MEYVIAVYIGLPLALIGVVLYKKSRKPAPKACPVVVSFNKAKKKKSKKSRK